MSKNMGRKKHRRLTVRHLKNRKSILLINQECKIFHDEESEYGEDYSTYYTKKNRNRALPLTTPWPDEFGGSMVGTGWKESTKRRRQRKDSGPSAKFINRTHIGYWDNVEINWVEVDSNRKGKYINIKKEDGLMEKKYEIADYINELAFLKEYDFSDDDILRFTEGNLLEWITPCIRQSRTEDLFGMMRKLGIHIRDLVVSVPIVLTWDCSDFLSTIIKAYPHFIDYEHFKKELNEEPYILMDLIDDVGDGNIGVDYAGAFREELLEKIDKLREESKEEERRIREAERIRERNARSIDRLEKQLKIIESKILYQELSHAEKSFDEMMEYILTEGKADTELTG